MVCLKLGPAGLRLEDLGSLEAEMFWSLEIDPFGLRALRTRSPLIVFALLEVG